MKGEKLSIESQYGPAISHLRLYPKDPNTSMFLDSIVHNGWKIDDCIYLPACDCIYSTHSRISFTCENGRKTQAVVGQAFNLSTSEAEAGTSLSSRTARAHREALFPKEEEEEEEEDDEGEKEEDIVIML